MRRASKYPTVRKWDVASGTFFTEEDENTYAAVAVLGTTVKKKMFGDEDPLGKYIIVNNVLFQVIGVMAERGADAGGRDQDDKVMVPYTTGSLRIFGRRFLRNVTISVTDESHMQDVQTSVSSLLLERHGTEDFTIRKLPGTEKMRGCAKFWRASIFSKTASGSRENV